ncbi:unnamed protein product [Rhizoctonia solani]|uniref:F-box domain-containing protein n=1 Tax=Rhizoctonia solani TaxID=456999 RepID=A0A8H3I220_9AGAM|nr:unnamed protein product [Rhizoctonia solani]
MDSTGFALCATVKALVIPEIATLIFSSGSLSQADLASLCRVSQYMSKIATQLLWRNVTAEGLLSLIKSTEYYRYKSDSPAFFHLDSYTSDQDNFKMFHFYAQYVETLEVYDRSGRCYRVEDWYLLRREIRARNSPLLPNLKALRFASTSTSLGLKEMKWISVFATPRLEEISLAPTIYSHVWPILFPIASTILKTIFEFCPGIQTLALATADDDLDAEELTKVEGRALAHRPPRPWYQELKRLTKLRHLTVSEGWLYPASLQELGSLPELESLTIVPGSLDNFNHKTDIETGLPNGAFTCLTKLSLLGLDGLGFNAVLSITGLSRKITIMKLELYFDSLEPEEEFEELFDGLRHASCLRELHIRHPFQPEKGDKPINIYSSMENMGLHPSLEHVYLDGIRIKKRYRRDSRPFRRLAVIWPNVQTLWMPSQHASLQELKDFARLTSLSHLTVKLNLGDPRLPAELKFKSAPLETLTSSGPVRLSTTYKDLSLSARALLRLWPSLRQVAWSDKDHERTQMADFFNSQVLRFNREKLFRGLEEDVRLSATQSTTEMKARFKLILEDVEQPDLDSDTDSDMDTDSETGT